MGVVNIDVRVSSHLKEELAWAVDTWFGLIVGLGDSENNAMTIVKIVVFTIVNSYYHDSGISIL